VRHLPPRSASGDRFLLLAIPTFRASNVAGCLFRVGAVALPFLIPLRMEGRLRTLGIAKRPLLLAPLARPGRFSIRPMARRAMQWLVGLAILVRDWIRRIVWAGDDSHVVVAGGCPVTESLRGWLGLARFVYLRDAGRTRLGDVHGEAASSAATSLAGHTLSILPMRSESSLLKSRCRPRCVRRPRATLSAELSIAFIVVGNSSWPRVLLFRCAAARLRRRHGQWRRQRGGKRMATVSGRS